jgi:hypothetical protein
MIDCIIFFHTKHRKNACSIFSPLTGAVHISIFFRDIIGTIFRLTLITNPEKSNLVYPKTRLHIPHTLKITNQYFHVHRISHYHLNLSFNNIFLPHKIAERKILKMFFYFLHIIVHHQQFQIELKFLCF